MKHKYGLFIKEFVLSIFICLCLQSYGHAKENKSSPPYIIIEPRDIKIQMAGSVAIVSFTLNDPGMLGRRTIVLKKEKEQWLIIHLHASGVPV